MAATAMLLAALVPLPRPLPRPLAFQAARCATGLFSSAAPGRHPAAGAGCTRGVRLPRPAAVAPGEESAASAPRVPLAPSPLVEAMAAWARPPAPGSVTAGAGAPAGVAALYHDDYGFTEGWDPNHRFVMGKFAGMVRVARALPGVAQQLRWMEPDDGGAPLEAVERVHERGFVRAFCAGALDAKAVRKIGLPQSPALVRRTLLEVEGTRAAARMALRDGLACNCGGGAASVPLEATKPLRGLH
jgi:hypothetical protein